MDGTFQRLDSGVLDVGVVRDSTHDATNDYKLCDSRNRGLRFDPRSRQLETFSMPRGSRF